MNHKVKTRIREKLHALGESIQVPGGYRIGEWAMKEIELKNKSRESFDETAVYRQNSVKPNIAENPLSSSDVVDFSIYDQNDATNYDANPMRAKREESKAALFDEEAVYAAQPITINNNNSLVSVPTLQREESLFPENDIYQQHENTESLAPAFVKSNPLNDQRPPVQRNESSFEADAIYNNNQVQCSHANPLADQPSAQMSQEQQLYFYNDNTTSTEAVAPTEQSSSANPQEDKVIPDDPKRRNTQLDSPLYVQQMSVEQQHYFYDDDDNDSSLDLSQQEHEFATITAHKKNAFTDVVQQAMLAKHNILAPNDENDMNAV